MADPDNPTYARTRKTIEATAHSLGVQSLLLAVRSPEDIRAAFAAASNQGVDGLSVGTETVTQANRRLITELAVEHRLPAIYGSREFVDVGGLIAYGVNYPDLYRRAASYVDRILQGARPADLPIEQPTKFEMVVNSKAAKAIGLSIPAAFLVRADEVIE
jgi:putative ABC transport system substrate-binding protein